LCQECGNLQLRYQVAPEYSYEGYHYTSKTTIGLNQEFVEYAQELQSFASDQKDINVLDIGSNDGSFLFACRENNILSFGIEPSTRHAEAANARGLPTLATYFDGGTKSLIEKTQNYPDIYDYITFNNVLANLPNPAESLASAVDLLRPETGKIVIQSGYHPLQFRRGLFDWTYHEHFSYFSLRSLVRLAASINMTVLNFRTMPLRGGSFRAILGYGHTGQLVNYEAFTDVESFSGFRKFISSSREHLHERLLEFKNKSFKIVGFGASHSTGILVHSFDIKDSLSYLIDDNQAKHGLYMPGTSLIVKSPNCLLSDCSTDRTVVVILAWQYYDIIVDRIRALGFTGPIISPVLL